MAGDGGYMRGLNEHQLAVVAHTDGPIAVPAVAGCGKTRTLVARIARLIESGVDPERILAVTFSQRAAREMLDRLDEYGAEDARVGTFHSLALELVRAERHDLRGYEVDDSDRYRIVVKDALGYRGLDWKNGDPTVVSHFIGLAKARGIAHDDPRLEPFSADFHRQRPCLQRDPTLLRMAYAAAEQGRHAKGLLTFDDMLLDAAVLLRNDEVRERWAAKWDHVLQDEAQDESPVQTEIASSLARDHRRYMVVGDPAQCHPPGVMIESEPGVVTPIERLRDGDRVRGWNRNAQKMISGRVINVQCRSYTGTLHTISVGGRSVPMTSNHKVMARWTDRGVDDCVTYLMHRDGFGYRVGWCKLFSGGGDGSRGFHLAQRAKIEKADGVWILAVHTGRTDASVYESVIAAGYGIPTATFEPVEGAAHQTADAIGMVFGHRLVRENNDAAGRRCLSDHGLLPGHPIWPFPRTQTDDPDAAYVRGTYFAVYASNVLPELMSLPLPDAQNAWAPVSGHDTAQYDGPVYSLDVEKDHAYAANGVVVLNSIYGWRGASSDVLTHFEREWPGARVVALDANYRSAGAIVDAANAVMRTMAPGSTLGTEMRATREESGSVGVFREADFDAEGRAVVKLIKEAVVDGRSWQDFAVLYRTNAQSRAVEEACLAENVPYFVVGGTNFYNRKEVKDLLAYIRVAEGRGGFDDVRRCINTPFRYLGRAFLDGLERAGGGAVGPEWAALARSFAAGGRSGLQQRQVSSAVSWAGLVDSLAERIERAPESLLTELTVETDYMRYLVRNEGEETVENARVSNVRELIRCAGRFGTVTGFLDHVDDVLERAEAAKRRGSRRSTVTLSTLHKSKGLEWPVVHVIGANEKILPHVRAEDLEEERRLFYVGVTRARDALWVSYVEGAVVGEKVVELGPSPFLKPVTDMLATRDAVAGGAS